MALNLLIWQVVSGVCYVSTYELVRHRLERSGVKDTKVKALCGGSAASVVGQTVIVPFDVISQHVMVLGLTANASNKSPFLIASPLAIDVTGKTKAQVTRAIIRTIYQRDGPRGFYRGYLAALCNYVPSSACWWGFYSTYQEAFTALNSPLPHTAVQCGAAVLSGCTTSLITNPLDLIRTRVQVYHLRKLPLINYNTGAAKDNTRHLPNPLGTGGSEHLQERPHCQNDQLLHLQHRHNLWLRNCEEGVRLT